MDMQNVAKLEIPEGEVKTIHDKNGDLLWGKVNYSVKYKGNTAQNGTPTPDAPVPVQTVTGENVVKICKKNLYDEQLRAGDISQPYANPTIRLCSTQNLYLYPGTYTFSSNIASPMRYALGVNSVSAPPTGTYPTYIYDSGWTVGTGSNTTTFTINQGGYFSVQLSKVNNAELTTSEAQAYHYQLEFGSTASAYESYQIQSYEVNLGNIELCKISTYQDYIYKSGGKWYVHKETGKQLVDTSTILLQSNYSNIEYARIPEPSDYIGYNTYIDHPLICSNAVYQDGGASPVWDNAARIGYIYTRPENIRFWIGFAKGTGLNAIKTMLAGCVIYYQLATPTDTEITNQALIAQLDAVNQWMTRYGYNASVTGNLPIIIDKTQL